MKPGPARRGLLGAVATGMLAASAGRTLAQPAAEGLAAAARATGCTFGTAVDSMRLGADPAY
ncbi:MAG: hypothetical protein EON47_13120, partial [Acetobacteraceae bacterium]